MLPLKPVDQQEGRGSCGPACLKIILDYYKIRTTEKELIKLLKTTPEYGTKGSAFGAAAKHFKLSAAVHDNATLKDIKKYLNKKIPVIVAWFSGVDTHYSVVVGMDSENIYLQDPELGHLRAMHRTWFNRVWFDFWGNHMKTKNDLILRRMIVVQPPTDFRML
jgi:predicted double-glycine peptidase